MPGYISEFSVYGNSTSEFVEIAVPAGTDVSGYSVAIYDSSGNVSGTFSLGSSVSTIAGSDVYTVNESTPGFGGVPNPGNFEEGGAVALVDDTGTALQFLSYRGYTQTANDGPAAGLTSTNAGSVGFGQSLQSDDGGASYFTQSEPNSGTIPCYAPGTLIDTPQGPRPVETLQAGDLVLTRDHGPQVIRCTRSGDQPLERAEREAKPVLIKAGALGYRLPGRDLIVSPQHRIFVGNDGQLVRIFKDTAFAPAKALVGLRGIRHMMGKKAITWIHFACDRHEVVRANECWSESLLLGPSVMQALTKPQRDALYKLFRKDVDPPVSGGLSALNGPPAWPCLRVGEVRKIIAEYSKEEGRRTAREIRKWDVDLVMELYEAECLQEANSARRNLPLRGVS